MTVTIYKWTTDRYHQAIEAGIFADQAVELLEGEIVIMPPEREAHAYYSTKTSDYLRKSLGEQALIRDAKPITLTNQSEPKPDIAIVKPLGTIYLEHHPYPEDIFWLIEFSQTSLEKDLGKKRTIYSSAGIREYWVINLQDLQLKVFRDLINHNYTTELTLTSGTISPLAFPSLNMEVKLMFKP